MATVGLREISLMLHVVNFVTCDVRGQRGRGEACLQWPQAVEAVTVPSLAVRPGREDLTLPLTAGPGY